MTSWDKCMLACGLAIAAGYRRSEASRLAHQRLIAAGSFGPLLALCYDVLVKWGQLRPFRDLTQEEKQDLDEEVQAWAPGCEGARRRLLIKALWALNFLITDKKAVV